MMLGLNNIVMCLVAKTYSLLLFIETNSWKSLKVAKAAMRAIVSTEEAWMKVWCKHMQAVVAWEAEKVWLIKVNPKIGKKDLPLKPHDPQKATQGGGNSAGPLKGPRAF